MSMTTGWESPSNIAIIKYWGKYGNQLPCNPSISFTLKNCHTRTLAHFEESQNGPTAEVIFEGAPAPAFLPKVEKLLKSVLPELPELENLHLRIETQNSFPHSSGIASSASGMSALALCLASLKFGFPEKPGTEFFHTASRWSRLGSGSACRSVYGGMAVWGQADFVKGSHQEFAVPYEEMHSVFRDFKDTILLIDVGEKKVSSTAGHGLMDGHPFAQNRFDFAMTHFAELDQALKSGDIEKFGAIAEREALMLHAMMMTSNPQYLLMRPNTLSAIEAVLGFRNDTKTPLYFTLDAGANLHLLYPAQAEHKVMEFVESALVGLCREGRYICDEVGQGPKQIFTL